MTQAGSCPAEVISMSTPALSLRRLRRPTPAAPTSSLRQEVCPPSLCHAPDSIWQRAVFWLLAPAPQEAAPPPSRLPAVRDDFHACVADIVIVPDAGDLVRRIELARSLRELWHLRTEVYRLVAVQHSQAEAEERLARLNRHFPTRAPRSGFAPL
jgi:hypothetical protein